MAARAEIPVPVKNADRIVYPVAGFTKGQVVEYYVRIAPWMLPHLEDRPVTLKRYPDEAGGEFFYEKDAPAFTPPWVKTFPVWRRSGESQIHYILINDERTLAWAASVGTLEIHTFLAKAPQFEVPSEIVFDLDPGPGADILNCGEVALLLRELLQQLRLKALVKVSGSKGMQVYVPLNTPENPQPSQNQAETGHPTYGETQAFARTLAEMLAKEHPKLIVAEMERAQRNRRVLIDWSQNADYKTTVSVYSLRAKRRHPYVSMPVSWEEVREVMEAREAERLYFQADAAVERVKRVGDLFAPVLTLKQELPEAFRVPGMQYRISSITSRRSPKTQPSSRTEPPRASAQGGRRRFAVVEKDRGRELIIELHDVLRAWLIPERLPTNSGATARAKEVEVAPEEAGRIFGGPAWDSGTVELIEGNYAKGYLDLYFSGGKLKGEWVMVAGPGTQEWRMIRAAEGRSYAPETFLKPSNTPALAKSGRERGTRGQKGSPRSRTNAVHLPSDLGPLVQAPPRFLTPMECRVVDSVPSGAGWIYELKLDGYRIIGVKKNGEAHLFSRYGNPFTDRFPVIGRALRDSALDDCVLDGEIVALDEHGRPSFQELQNARTTDRPIVYYVFDLLNYGGRDLLRVTLRNRKGALEAVARGFLGPVRLAAVVEDEPELLLEEVRRRGLEGVVAKRSESIYEVGKRSGAWVKYRVAEREEFVIGGYLPGGNYLDALLVGRFQGKKLLFVKKVRNGFVPRTRREVYEAIKDLRIPNCPFANLPEPSDRRGAVDAEEMKNCVWVKPQVRCEVEFAEWTAGGRLRHAAFRQLLGNSEALQG